MLLHVEQAQIASVKLWRNITFFRGGATTHSWTKWLSVLWWRHLQAFCIVLAGFGRFECLIHFVNINVNSPSAKHGAVRLQFFELSCFTYNIQQTTFGKDLTALVTLLCQPAAVIVALLDPVNVSYRWRYVSLPTFIIILQLTVSYNPAKDFSLY